MTGHQTASAPTLELLAWIAATPRTYAETMGAWKTACPRLAVWEDAVAEELVRVERGRVVLTRAGGEAIAREPPR